MENKQDNSSSNTENKGNSNRTAKIAILIVLLLLPIVYLFVKTSGTTEPPKEQAAANQPAKTDIASLENAANSNPTFDNLINVSMAYINNKMPEKSIIPLQKAIAINPNSAIAYNNLGVAYIMMQQYQEGIDACNKALSIDATFQLAKNNFKWGMDEKNKLESAIKTQEQTPKEKRTVAYYIDYGMSYYKIKNYDKAIEQWSKIADLDKKNTAALNNIGTAFMMKMQYDDAIALFKKAIEYEPNNQLAKNNLAWAQDEKRKASIKK